MRRESSAPSPAVASATKHLPPHVLSAISELAADISVREIWLVGSQINGTASPASDWDLLVFANSEPEVREVRFSGVDVIWKGPTNTLLEGQPESQQINFSNFMWNEGSDGTAEYVGYKFNEFEPGAVRDASTPLVLRPCQRAVRVWPIPNRRE
jgi:hypothetical protein